MDKPELRSQLLQTLTLRVSASSCQPVLHQLDEYVDAQLANGPYTTRFPAVALHLDACVACAEAYELLYSSALAEANGALPQVVAQPHLAFLTPRPTHTLIEQIRSAVQRIGEQISLQLTPTLLPALRPTLATATLRGTSAGQRYHEKLLELRPEPSWPVDWPVTVVAYSDSQQPAVCLLEVTVEPPGRSWPDLEGIQVTVRMDAEQRSSITDAWGVTAFAAVSTTWLTTLKLEVML